jgi:hypothetical protein
VDLGERTPHVCNQVRVWPLQGQSAGYDDIVEAVFSTVAHDFCDRRLKAAANAIADYGAAELLCHRKPKRGPEIGLFPSGLSLASIRNDGTDARIPPRMLKNSGRILRVTRANGGASYRDPGMRT